MRPRFDKAAAQRNIAGTLSRLSGGLTDGGVAPESKWLDMRLSMWAMIDRIVRGDLTIEDTNEMGRFGNICVAMSCEEQNDEAFDMCNQWQHIVLELRKRWKSHGRCVLTGEQLQQLREAASYLHEWMPTQPPARVRRAIQTIEAMGPLKTGME